MNDSLFENLTDQEIDDIVNTLREMEEAEQQHERICDCGCEKLYGKSSTVHSEWCSKIRKD